MKVQKINLLPRNYAVLRPAKEEQNFHNENTVTPYRGFAYRDYNISFTERLFRTPANFFEFNKNRLPDTMNEYLNDDYDDRQNMPPIQMWKIVFADLNNAENFDEVKELYPDEPLFKNLNEFSGKAISSVISEIQTLEDEFKTTPLFKDGSSDFGMYLLKKIYFDGKGIYEINKDFKKDINDDYKGLITKDITQHTTRTYGIKFPNTAFWNSFVVTREDFPYVYKPLKAILPRRIKTTEDNEQGARVSNHTGKTSEKKKFDKVKDWEINKLTDAMVKGKGSRKEVQKRLKNTNVRDEDALNFTAKYFSEINSIVMRRLHVSDEMRDYFEHYEELNKTQQEKFEEYWKNPELNKLQSIVMKDTIRLFFDTYGADGNNDDFKELLQYARDIKPKRLERQKEHDLKQAEYEKALAVYDKQDTEIEPVQTAVIDIDDDDEHDKLAEFQKLLDDAKKEYDVNTYDFETENGKVTIVSNLREALDESIKFNTRMMPKAFSNKFVLFMQNHPDVTSSYILSSLLADKGIELPADDRLLPQEKLEDMTNMFYQHFTDDFPNENRAAKQAVTDAFIEMTKDDITPALFSLGVFEFAELFKSMEPNAKDFIMKQSKMINEKYGEYKRPLTDYEIYKIKAVINTLLRKYNPDNTIINKNSPFYGFNKMFDRLRYAVSDDKSYSDEFDRELKAYLPLYGGSARFFLNKNMPLRLKMAKLEEFLCSYTYDQSRDKEGLKNALTKDGKNKHCLFL